MLSKYKHRLLLQIISKSKNNLAENFSQVIGGCDLYSREYPKLLSLEKDGVIMVEHFGHGVPMRIHIVQMALPILSLLSDDERDE
jgi:hypothetical protein